ncbi:hypothetical protein [Streptomyces sp. NPDC058955]|uniref:hypothetical protein n=1 Tax=unclassified Streptomyces TaxID=2593676 RepID=UPI003668773E
MAVVAGLLFLAFVYFAVGQAAVLRNGGQTAADAAALGAAQDAREQLRDSWLDVMGDTSQWQPFLQGREYDEDRACQRAMAFASLNDAELLPEDCVPVDFGFSVTVQTVDTVGDSIVPGADEQRATATASAVVEPLCSFEPPEPGTDPPTEPDPSSSPPGEPEEEDPGPIKGLICDGEAWEIDPEDPTLPGVDDLFRVRLTGDDE